MKSAMGPKLVLFIVYAALSSDFGLAQARRIEINHERSLIFALVDKQGLLTAFGAGHKHAVLATEWSADICLDRDHPRNSSALITIPTASLVIDSPKARMLAGLGATGPSEGDVREIQERMLGADILEAITFNHISFRTTELTVMRDNRWNWSGSITIRGVTKPVEFPAKVDLWDPSISHIPETSAELPNPNRYLIQGVFTLKQSDFGIVPVSIGGLVKVKDEIEIGFALDGVLTSRACPSSPQ